MRSVKGTLNRVELVGHLGADPEMRFLASGKAVCRFSVATNHVSGQDEAGRREYETDWVNVEAWERLAELCNTYMHKGSRACVSGSLRTDSWLDKESGQTRYKTYVRAEDVIFLDTKPGGDAAATSEQAEVDEEVPF